MANSGLCSLIDLSGAFSDKVELIKKTIILKNIEDGGDLMKTLELVDSLEILLGEMRLELQKQRESIKNTEALKKKIELLNMHLKHSKENIPDHIPKNNKSVEVRSQIPIQETKSSVSDESNLRKPDRKLKKVVPEISYLQIDEFETIPKYQRGRLTYKIINHYVDEINKGINAKYSLLNIPIKKLSGLSHDKIILYKSQHTNETKGLHFIVDDDIKENSAVKFDKQFINVLSILRSCKRLKEIRGGGITRYVIC